MVIFVVMQFYSVPVLNIEKLTTDAVCISFDVPTHLKEIFAFTQGQYITLKTIINGAEVRRSYSICSSVQSGLLQIGVKKVQDGIFSTYANDVLKIGDIIELAAPLGKFNTQLIESQTKKYLGVAAGSGITPLMSLIATTMHHESSSSFTLIYGNKIKASTMFAEELEALKNKYINRLQVVHILSQTQQEAALFCGRINAQKCEQLALKILNIKSFNEAFLCGPEDMVLDVKQYLIANGLSSKNVHVELFGVNKNKAQKIAHQPTIETAGKICALTVIKDGNIININLPFETDNVLDAALKTNADMPFACKGGVCCTCKARLTHGEVYMDVNYGLEPDEIAAGFILTCQAFPVTEAVTVNFDDV
jgi:ring-1,2-phenylacetyl-CoA epoxidase subunit PaaE